MNPQEIDEAIQTLFLTGDYFVLNHEDAKVIADCFASLMMCKDSADDMRKVAMQMIRLNHQMRAMLGHFEGDLYPDD